MTVAAQRFSQERLEKDREIMTAREKEREIKNRPMPKTLTRYAQFEYKSVIQPPNILPKSARVAPLTNALNKCLKGLPVDLERVERPVTKERKEKNYHGFRIPDFE